MVISFAAFAVFKKYSSVLLDKFPVNYMASLEVFNQIYPAIIPSETVEYITAPTSYKAVNQRILELLINLMMKSTTQDRILDLVCILSRIIGDFKNNAVLSRFENGNSTRSFNATLF